jgi:hypothetical protein
VLLIALCFFTISSDRGGLSALANDQGDAIFLLLLLKDINSIIAFFLVSFSVHPWELG